MLLIPRLTYLSVFQMLSVVSFWINIFVGPSVFCFLRGLVYCPLFGVLLLCPSTFGVQKIALRAMGAEYVI